MCGTKPRYLSHGRRVVSMTIAANEAATSSLLQRAEDAAVKMQCIYSPSPVLREEGWGEGSDAPLGVLRQLAHRCPLTLPSPLSTGERVLSAQIIGLGILVAIIPFERCVVHSMPPRIDGELRAYFSPPQQFAGQLGSFRSPLLFDDGTRVQIAEDWQLPGGRRSSVIGIRSWGPWPDLIDHPKIEYLQTEQRENFTQHKIRIEIARGLTDDGYLLIPPGSGPFPAVFVPYYEPETSVGLGTKTNRDFAQQLTRRGFVTLAIGSPGGDARKPDTAGSHIQPLSFLEGMSAPNWCATTRLAPQTQVDRNRIGVVGHSYGGKWAMFTSCLDDRYAAAVWSDPGIVWDEARKDVNYWEPWYLGLDASVLHRPGLITPDHPRTGAYKMLVEGGHDLIELHALDGAAALYAVRRIGRSAFTLDRAQSCRRSEQAARILRSRSAHLAPRARSDT